MSTASSSVTQYVSEGTTGAADMVQERYSAGFTKANEAYAKALDIINQTLSLNATGPTVDIFALVPTDQYPLPIVLPDEVTRLFNLGDSAVSLAITNDIWNRGITRANQIVQDAVIKVKQYFVGECTLPPIILSGLLQDQFTRANFAGEVYDLTRVKLIKENEAEQEFALQIAKFMVNWNSSVTKAQLNQVVINTDLLLEQFNLYFSTWIAQINTIIEAYGNGGDVSARLMSAAFAGMGASASLHDGYGESISESASTATTAENRITTTDSTTVATVHDTQTATSTDKTVQNEHSNSVLIQQSNA